MSSIRAPITNAILISTSYQRGNQISRNNKVDLKGHSWSRTI